MESSLGYGGCRAACCRGSNASGARGDGTPDGFPNARPRRGQAHWCRLPATVLLPSRGTACRGCINPPAAHRCPTMPTTADHRSVWRGLQALRECVGALPLPGWTLWCHVAAEHRPRGVARVAPLSLQGPLNSALRTPWPSRPALPPTRAVRDPSAILRTVGGAIALGDSTW